MKKWWMVIVVAAILIACACSGFKQTSTTYLRVHIRANSNLAIDQEVKYLVKNEVVEFLTPLLAEGQTFDQAKVIVRQNLTAIEQIATKVLAENGFSYTANAHLNEEYFPTRTYSSYTLESGFYDALILNLGTGEGDNWWCVVYPPLCFTAGNGTTVEYRSKIWEIICNWNNQR